MTSPDNFLVVGAVLFVLGAIGFLTRRNLILMMLSAELMLHGVSLNFVAFSSARGNFQGQVFTIFILTIAACEAGIALALILALYRRRKTLDIRAWSDLGEPSHVRRATIAVPVANPVKTIFPRLARAGRMPARILKRGKSDRESADV